MLSTKQRMDATSNLSLEQRKQILADYFKGKEYRPKFMSERQRDALVAFLRDKGYYPPMFDHAFRLLVSSQRKERTK